MTIEIANVQSYYDLKDDGNAVLSSADGSETKTISYKRYCQDTGVELDSAVVLFTIDELSALKTDYENKIAMINLMIDEINNL